MDNYAVLRPLLFLGDPERSHRRVIRSLHLLGQTSMGLHALHALYAPQQREAVSVMGLTFPNRLGVAAGLDKEGEAAEALGAMGFGHVEVGTVTMRPQKGNPKPRVFRLPEDHAIINRMGFPSEGVDAVVARLRALRRPYGTILGVNIGLNKETPSPAAPEEYRDLFARVAPYADYVTINVSSPNTKGLRDHQKREALARILARVKACQASVRERTGRYVPLVLKISPDLEEEALMDLLDAVLLGGVDGLCVANTTVKRDGVKSHKGPERGGLSGAPLLDRTCAMIQRINKETEGTVPITGVGGIFTRADADRVLGAGACLIQVYTGLVYQGPAIVRGILDVP